MRDGVSHRDLGPILRNAAGDPPVQVLPLGHAGVHAGRKGSSHHPERNAFRMLQVFRKADGLCTIKLKKTRVVGPVGNPVVRSGFDGCQ